MSDLQRILVVEDEPLLQQLVRRLLEEYRYEVITAGSGEEAIGHAIDAGLRLDLAILDVTLPGMDGPALATHLPPATPVLFISGYGDRRSREDLGAHLMGKPFALDQLAACVRDLLATGYCAACAPTHLTRRRDRGDTLWGALAPAEPGQTISDSDSQGRGST